jgi:hypothetical protein
MSPAVIIAIGSAIRELIQAAVKAREAMRQSEEWTVAQEEAFAKEIEGYASRPEWRTDDQQG